MEPIKTLKLYTDNGEYCAQFCISEGAYTVSLSMQLKTGVSGALILPKDWASTRVLQFIEAIDDNV